MITSIFSFTQNVFKSLLLTLHQIQNCHQQTLSVWKSLKFVVLERVKMSLKTLDYVVKSLGLTLRVAPPGWLSGERVGLMTWWF